MSLFSTLNTGASGLHVNGTGLGVIGDNIANLGTTGFKRSGARFADAFPNLIGTLGGTAALGSGAVVAGIATEFGQGMLQSTGSALDIAITGPGWFQVSDGSQDYYTRDGSFTMDKDGYLTTWTGLRVQGVEAEDGVLGATSGDIQVDLGPFPPSATTEVTLDATLPNDTDWTDTNDYLTDQAAGLYDGASVDIDTATAPADATTSTTVYDSLGQAHDLVIVFNRTADDTWEWSALVDGGEVDLGGGIMGADGMALEIASGTMTFDTDGEMTSFTQTTPATAGPWTWPGAAPWTFTLDLGLDPAGNTTDGSVTDNGTVYAVNNIQQDGWEIGELTNLDVDPDGTIRGNYTNGQDVVLGQIQLATFASEAGLDRLGNNLFAATWQSGDPAIGVPGSGTRGFVTGYALEASNVDLEQELVGMITVQRSYQANAGVVRTADETLQELVNLV